MKKLLSLIAVLTALVLNASAESFMVNGIRYVVVGSNTVKTDINWDTEINDYDIPEIVEYDGRAYAVSGIGTYLTSAESKSVKIPQTIQVIENMAFAHTESLTKVYIANIGAWVGIDFQGENSNPLSRKNYTNISVFINGEQTRDIIIPEEVGYISNKSFYCCYWLSSIQLPTTLSVIQPYAFYRCWGMKSITLPENISDIGDYAFYECNGLDSVVAKFSEPIELSGGHQFDDMTYSRATLYVPNGCKSAFQSAPVWSNFANIVEMESSGIHSVSSDKSNGKVYTLGGVELPSNGKAKGTVIQSGRKTMSR